MKEETRKPKEGESEGEVEEVSAAAAAMVVVVASFEDNVKRLYKYLNENRNQLLGGTSIGRAIGQKTNINTLNGQCSAF